MHSQIDRFFSEDVPHFTSALGRIERRILAGEEPTRPDIRRELTQCIHESLNACTRLERDMAGETPRLREVQARYREAIAPWFRQSWFMCRAIDKPRGYPGDFELLTAIYDNEPKSLGMGGYLDQYFLDTALARAVRARMRSVRQFLLNELAERDEDVTILNVACGSCREYLEDFAPSRSSEVRVICVDNDPLALDFVRTVVAPQILDHVTCDFVRYNALRMVSAARNIEKFGRPDVIYSVGLCDYIPDQLLIPMLRGWRETLGDGGVLYVAFKDAQRYETPDYQWLVDWFFFQRTDEQCRQLFAAAGYDLKQMTATRDATGIIINYVSRALVRVQVRVDQAASVPPAPQLSRNINAAEEPTVPLQ